MVNKPNGLLTKKDLQEAEARIRKELQKKADKDDLKNFATKDDLKRFATKDDLKNFATKDDLKRFATKDDLKNFATKDDLNQLREELVEIKDEVVGELKAMREEFEVHTFSQKRE